MKKTLSRVFGKGSEGRSLTGMIDGSAERRNSERSPRHGRRLHSRVDNDLIYQSSFIEEARADGFQHMEIPIGRWLPDTPVLRCAHTYATQSHAHAYDPDIQWENERVASAGSRSPHTSANPCANTTTLRCCNYTPPLTGISPVFHSVFMQTKSFMIGAFRAGAENGNKRRAALIPFDDFDLPKTRNPAGRAENVLGFN